MEEDYTYPAVYDLESFRDSFAFGAVDLSETTDLTCAKILLMRKDDKTKYIYTKYFIPESKLEKAPDAGYGANYPQWALDGHVAIHEGNENDLARVADWFYSLYTDYGIRLIKVGYDVKYAREFLNRMDEYGFECEMVAQNKITLSNAMKLVEADLKGQLINYNENPVDRWCLGNASMEIDNLGNVMAVKINNQAGRRIDGAVTLIILYEIYRRYRTVLNNKLQ
jgi:phage terminase large subunit-like protein